MLNVDLSALRVLSRNVENARLIVQHEGVPVLNAIMRSAVSKQAKYEALNAVRNVPSWYEGIKLVADCRPLKWCSDAGLWTGAAPALFGCAFIWSRSLL